MEDDICPICLECCEGVGLLMFPCGHTFHRRCCSDWMKNKVGPKVDVALLKMYSPAAGPVSETTKFLVGRYADIVEHCPICRAVGSWLHFDYSEPGPVRGEPVDLAEEDKGIIRLKEIRCLIHFAEDLVSPVVDISDIRGLNLFRDHPRASRKYGDMFRFAEKCVRSGCKDLHVYALDPIDGILVCSDPVVKTTLKDGAEKVIYKPSPFSKARHAYPIELYRLSHTLFPEFYC